eukprot:1715587-Lingulodinium_polyedra.AAC.1
MQHSGAGAPPAVIWRTGFAAVAFARGAVVVPPKPRAGRAARSRHRFGPLPGLFCVAGRGFGSRP